MLPMSSLSTDQPQINIMEENKSLVVKQPMSLDQIRDFAKDVASSRMFGIDNPNQAVCLMMICQSEGIDPIMALRRYHLIEGRPSMRADAMQGEFMSRGGAIIWHVRTDDMVAATFFADKDEIDEDARTRAASRFDKLWALDNEEDAAPLLSVHCHPARHLRLDSVQPAPLPHVLELNEEGLGSIGG